MTNEEIDEKIKNLQTWVHFYDEKIVRLEKQMSDFKHGGYPSDPPPPGFLGMSSIEQCKASDSEGFDRIMDRHLDKAMAFNNRILVVKYWREEVIQKIKHFEGERK